MFERVSEHIVLTAGKDGTGNLLTGDARLAEWFRLIRGEYLEVPGLCLTKPQVRRLWGLDAQTCEVLLAALVDARFLRCTREEAYVRAEGER